MSIPLEDNFEDIVGKAGRGLGLSAEEIAARAGISPAAVEALLNGEFDEAAARAVAPVLNLHADALVASGKKAWAPKPVEVEGLLAFNTQSDDMTVNNYVVFDPASKAAAVFDTGGDASPALEAIQARGLNVETIFLTHTHYDHVERLADLQKAFPLAPVYVGHGELLPDAKPVRDGDAFTIGALKVVARETSGHARCGITYVVEGLERPVAVVGDALFAGSMGGGLVSWPDALANNRAKIFPLPDDTVVASGHGPLTTVGEEKANNPFYPEFKS